MTGPGCAVTCNFMKDEIGETYPLDNIVPLSLPGQDITEKRFEETQRQVDNIDWEYASKKEAEFRHDVMGHIHCFGHVLSQGIGTNQTASRDVCPMTSCLNSASFLDAYC